MNSELRAVSPLSRAMRGAPEMLASSTGAPSGPREMIVIGYAAACIVLLAWIAWFVSGIF